MFCKITTPQVSCLLANRFYQQNNVKFEIFTQPTPPPHGSTTTISDIYHNIKSCIADAILKQEKCENPNVAVVICQFNIPAKRLIN